MIKKIYLPLMLLMTLAFVGCNKDMKPLSADYFTVTPSPLEVVGGQVPATVLELSLKNISIRNRL